MLLFTLNRKMRLFLLQIIETDINYQIINYKFIPFPQYIDTIIEVSGIAKLIFQINSPHIYPTFLSLPGMRIFTSQLLILLLLCQVQSFYNDIAYMALKKQI